MTKEEIIEANPVLVQMIGNHGVGVFKLVSKVMDEYAKQQAIAFYRHLSGFSSLPDQYLGDKFNEFIEQQHNKIANE